MEKKIQITSGRGPKECNLMVSKVLFMLLKEAAKRDIIIVEEQNDFKSGLSSSVTLHLKGQEVVHFVERWKGTIQWICKSPYRPHHKRKNWFVAVLEVPDFNKVFTLDKKDVIYQAIRSSGPGGQHVNKVSTAIQATHIPTGIRVQVMDSRSQLQNKQLVFQRLQDHIRKIHEEKYVHVQTEKWLNQVNIDRGNAIRTFIGTGFQEGKIS